MDISQSVKPLDFDHALKIIHLTYSVILIVLFILIITIFQRRLINYNAKLDAKTYTEIGAEDFTEANFHVGKRLVRLFLISSIP